MKRAERGNGLYNFMDKNAFVSIIKMFQVFPEYCQQIHTFIQSYPLGLNSQMECKDRGNISM